MSHIFSLSRTYLRLAKRNLLVFVGLAIFLCGLLGFSHGKYCNGNTVTYYDCTSPAVYYYYSTPALMAVIIGSWFLAMWMIKKEERRDDLV